MIVLKKSIKQFDKLLIEKEMTQSKLAKELGINRVGITNLKNGTKSSIGEIKVRKLCRILDVNFEEWFIP